MRRIYKTILLSAAGVVIILAFVLAFVLYQHHNGVVKAENDFREYDPPKIQDFGSTKTLSVLPLVNWHTESAGLKTEMGVSYLVKTDSATILFDLGHNAEEEAPSPLEHNMEQLGIGLENIDMVFLSHNHFDHVGGQKWVDEGSFSLGNEQADLAGKEIYTPVPKTYPGTSPVHTPEPRVLAPGVATTGTIPRKLIIGRINEQSLAVHVAEKGLVLIVGCGHQTVPRLLERTEAVFDIPVYGIIGDLHYPVPEGRIQLAGLNAQRLLASGDGPFYPLTKNEVLQNIELLESRDIGIVGVGGHDSSDEVIEIFKNTFGDAYRPVIVGKRIELSGDAE